MNTLMVAGTLVAVEVLQPTSGLVRTRATLQPPDGAPISFVVPGANGGPPMAVTDVPPLRVGQRWQVQLHEAAAGWVPVALGAGMHLLKESPGTVPPPYNLNGLHYEPEQLPQVFYLNQEGCAEVGAEATESEVQYGLETWTGVGCASWTFEFGGVTDLLPDDDGVNVIAWENESWEWGAEVAGMSMTRFDTDGESVYPAGADILFNGVDFAWTTEPGDVYASTPLLNLGSVLVHELGHVTGMDHEYDLVTSTMFYAYLGGDWMRSLSGDDRRGLCENYPNGEHECVDDGDCALIDDIPRHCEELDGIRVCAEDRDPVGSSCSRTDINCESLCVFTNPFATEGYCSQTCADGDCPRGFSCGEASLLVPDAGLPVCLWDGDTGLWDSGAPPDTAESTKDEAPERCGCQAGGALGGLLALLASLIATSRRRGL